jgi:hypothetical protein
MRKQEGVMADKHLSLKLAALAIGPNGREGQERVRNRFLFQLVHPKRDDDNPAVTFALGSVGGPVAARDLDAVLADGIVFKGQPFAQLFDEHVRIRIHHFQDVHADWLQVVAGKVFEAALDSLLGQVKLVSVSLRSLIDVGQMLQLGVDAYSQELGYFELVLDPNAERPGGAAEATVQLVAPEDVLGFAPLGPQGKPQRITIVGKGQATATMELKIRLI